MEAGELVSRIKSEEMINSIEINQFSDNSNWMGNLPTPLTFIPFHLLAIPGSHDSFSYTISRKTEITPDDAQLLFLNKIPCLRTLVKLIMYRWSKTQNLSCIQQLEAGIRYFDLRLAPCDKTKTNNIVHGLYGIQIQLGLMEILDFLLSHPKEVVLLDFQHFYNFSVKMHQQLMSNIKSIFGNILCPVVENLDDLTLQYLWKNKYQVIVFYRFGNCATLQDNCFWPSEFIPNPWPDTVDPNYLIEYLQHNYNAGRPKNKFYVTQGVLTPNTRFVLFRAWSTLETTLVSLVNRVLPGWLSDKNPGGLNVVISDFIGSSACVAQKVIQLNYKYLPSEKLITN